LGERARPCGRRNFRKRPVRAAASANPQATHKLVKQQGGELRFAPTLPRSLTHRLQRLSLDLRSVRPSNSRHGPLITRARALFPLEQLEIDSLPGPARLSLFHDPPHNLLLLWVRDLRSASL